MDSVSKREERYAEALHQAHWDLRDTERHLLGSYNAAKDMARAVMAVADAELAEAQSKVENLARGVIPNYTLDLLDIAREFKEVEGRPVLARWIRAVAALAPKDAEATR